MDCSLLASSIHGIFQARILEWATESQNCNTCSQINAAPRRRPKPPGIQLKGALPFEHLEVDFTEMRLYHHLRYLLVLVCTFLGWVEGFPSQTETASEVAQSLLRELVL